MNWYWLWAWLQGLSMVAAVARLGVLPAQASLPTSQTAIHIGDHSEWVGAVGGLIGQALGASLNITSLPGLVAPAWP